MIPDPGSYVAMLRPTLALIAIWCTLSSLELIAVRHAFAPGQALGTDLAALSQAWTARRILSSRFCTPRTTWMLLFLRLTAGIALPFVGSGPASIVLLVTIVGCTAWLSIVVGGSNGADKIALVACAAAILIVAGHLGDERWLCLAGLAWGAGQATIAYATSGIAKLRRGFWRDGTALAATMTSYRAGHVVAASVVRSRGVARALSWAIMLIEALFPLALLTSPAICLAVLVILALFHVSTAVVMGLNTYPWAFMATYPCIMMANMALSGAAAL